MPAPKRPNTTAATEAVRRRGQETMAARLREAGWTVIPPGLGRLEDAMAACTVRLTRETTSPRNQTWAQVTANRLTADDIIRETIEITVDGDAVTEVYTVDGRPTRTPARWV